MGMSECGWVSLGMLMAEDLPALTGALSLLTWAAAQEVPVVLCELSAELTLTSFSSPLCWQQHDQLHHCI